MNDKWATLRKNIVFSLTATTVVAVALSFWLFNPTAGAVTLISVLCLALGFWLTEGLVGVMTGVKQANGTAIGLLFLGKLAWWGLLFWLTRVYPPGTEIPIAFGLGAFLLALLIATIGHFGWPKISDAKGLGEP